MSYRDEVLVSHLSGESGSWNPAEETAAAVLARAEEATKVLSGWADTPLEEDTQRPGDWGLPTGAVDDMGRAYALLRHAERYIPDVMGWGVGYFWGRDDRAWSCFTAHVSIRDAGSFRDAWEEKANRNTRHSMAWIVRFCPCSITDFVRPGADAERYVAESGAFDR